MGIDVELARDLSRELGRPLEFVATTWTSLVRDARTGRFDMAMSGIMAVPSRAMFVDFSRPYHEGHHYAVVRCVDRDGLSTIDRLNRSEVTVFVRKGGTSASLALARLPRAQVRQVDSIEAAYDDLARGRGSVVLATGFLQRRYPDLCVGLDGAPFSTVSVSVLVPQNSPLLVVVNRWLTRRIEDGTVDTIIGHYQLP